MNGGNGKEKYGDDYADIYAINRLHFKAAMNNDCDHVSTQNSSSSGWAGADPAVCSGQFGGMKPQQVSSTQALLWVVSRFLTWGLKKLT